MRVPVTLVLFLVMVAAVPLAAAQRALEPVRLDPSASALPGSALDSPACLIGNDNPDRWYIGNWIWGDEAYAYRVQPAAHGCCPLGVTIESVTMLVHFSAEDVPTTFDVQAGLAESVWNGSGLVPGNEYCVSPPQQVSITEPGVHALSLPMDGARTCADQEYSYFVTFRFTTSFPSTKRPSPMLDEFPVGGTSFNDYGAGWEDLALYGFPGELEISAGVSCCDRPIADLPHTWGDVKGMYR